MIMRLASEFSAGSARIQREFRRSDAAAMTTLRRPVDVLMERIPLVNRWASERWQACAVALREPETGESASATGGSSGTAAAAPLSLLRDNCWLCAGFEIELHPSEAEGYYLNLTSPEPRVFVMWRFHEDGALPLARPVLVTVSYNEAGRYMDGGEQVDGVPMPPAIASWMQPFIDQHYKPEPRRKQRRNDPFAADTPRGGRDRRS